MQHQELFWGGESDLSPSGSQGNESGGLSNGSVFSPRSGMTRSTWLGLQSSDTTSSDLSRVVSVVRGAGGMNVERISFLLDMFKDSSVNVTDALNYSVLFYVQRCIHDGFQERNISGSSLLTRLYYSLSLLDVSGIQKPEFDYYAAEIIGSMRNQLKPVSLPVKESKKNVFQNSRKRGRVDYFDGHQRSFSACAVASGPSAEALASFDVPDNAALGGRSRVDDGYENESERGPEGSPSPLPPEMNFR